jgi:hypothetical protein
MKRRTFIRSLAAVSSFTLVGSASYGYKSSFVELSREELVLPQLKKRLKIVAISDLHAPSLYGSFENLAELINQESPDIFILAGDTVDRRGSESWVSVFRKVKARLAKLTVLGNWEYRGKLDLVQLKKEYEKAGFSLLVNKTVNVSGVSIIGLDDFVHGCPDYHILKKIPNGLRPVFLISHCPESFDQIAAFPPNPVTVISGHTHGGQIAPLGIVLYTPYGSGSYIKGWYLRGHHSMYVMRGIGTSGIPLRIGSKPEILVLNLVGCKA